MREVRGGKDDHKKNIWEDYANEIRFKDLFVDNMQTEKHKLSVWFLLTLCLF